MLPKVNSNIIDKVVTYFSPVKGAQRYRARASMSIYDNAVSGYDVPGSGRRFMRGINVDSNSPDADILPKRERSIALSRDMAMNTPLVVAALGRLKTNVVGTGLRFRSQIDYEFLGLTKETAMSWEKNTEREFKNWAGSKECDLTRQQNFYELQELAFLSILLSGDICVLYPHRKTNTLSPYRTRIKLIESDLLSNPDHMPEVGFNDIISGIKFDRDGVPQKYYFSNFYPGSNIYTTNNLNRKWVGINAEDKNGNKQVFHLFFKNRPGQKRGMSIIAPIINAVQKATKLMDAEVTAHVISAFFTVFVKNTKGFNNGITEGFAPDNSVLRNNDGTDKTPDDAFQLEMGSANILELNDDQDISIADPRKTTEVFTELYKAFVNEIAAALEIPYEQLMIHFSASYSASRGAILEAIKAVRIKRNWLASNFCQPTFEKWLEEAVAIGRISAPGFFEDYSIRQAWVKSSWSGMGNGQLDPLKETKAAVLRINNTLSNFEKEYNGIHDDGDWEGSTTKLGFEHEIIKSQGLTVKNDDTLVLAEEEPEEKENVNA